MAGGVAAIECHEEEGPMRTAAEDEATEDEEVAEVGWVAWGADEDADDISIDDEDEEEEKDATLEEADASESNT